MRTVLAAATSLLASLALSGCMWEFGNGQASSQTGGFVLSGTVSGVPINGQLTAAITPTGLCARGLTSYAGTVVLSDGTGTVTKQESLCQLSSDIDSGLVFQGQFTITAGTGAYQGASGGGQTTLRIGRNPVDPTNALFSIDEVGSIQVGAIASSERSRRTFKSRGVVSSVKRCGTAAGKQRGLTGWSRRCSRINLERATRLAP